MLFLSALLFWKERKKFILKFNFVIYGCCVAELCIPLVQKNVVSFRLIITGRISGNIACIIIFVDILQVPLNYIKYAMQILLPVNQSYLLRFRYDSKYSFTYEHYIPGTHVVMTIMIFLQYSLFRSVIY